MAIFELTIASRTWGNPSSYCAGDAHERCIVRANSFGHARRLAAGSAGDETPEAWHHETTNVLIVAPDGDGLVLARATGAYDER